MYRCLLMRVFFGPQFRGEPRGCGAFFDLRAIRILRRHRGKGVDSITDTITNEKENTKLSVYCLFFRIHVARFFLPSKYVLLGYESFRHTPSDMLRLWFSETRNTMCNITLFSREGMWSRVGCMDDRGALNYPTIWGYDHNTIIFTSI